MTSSVLAKYLMLVLVEKPTFICVTKDILVN